MPRPGPAATKARMWQQIQARTQPGPAAWRTSQFRWAAAVGPGRALGTYRLAHPATITLIFESLKVAV